MRWISSLTIVALVVGLAGALGCGTPERSAELQELEQKLQDEEAQRLREFPNSARYHDEARQYRRVAREAREDREPERSKEYARLGLLRYETAIAVYEKFQLVEDLEEINAKIEEINPEIRETMEVRNELGDEIAELDGELRQAVQRRQELRLAGADDDDGGFDPASGDPGAGDAQELEEANEMIAEARELREEALEFEADEYPETRGLFDRADSQLETARELLDQNPGSAGTAKRQVGFAVQLFEEARNEAEPIHEEYVEKMRPENRIDSIRDQARGSYGSQHALRETGGVRVVMARLFEQGETEYRHGTEPLIDALVDLAEEFEEFEIDIQGYTRRAGDTTENRNLARTRAQQVQDDLLDAGIDDGRISYDGLGQENPRYDDAQDNDRVEVVLRHEER